MELSNITITHISLVKSGANGKTIIYKSAKEIGKYENIFSIVKTDEEGIVYGIVYTPDKEDSQGDTATAKEIKKAAHAFVKSQQVGNVDVEHSFRNVDASVVESYIVKAGDADYPDDVGAWAVAIQLESDELKQMAKSGEIEGLSMAGNAVKKSSDGIGDDAFKNFFVMLADVVGGVSLDFYTRVEKGEKVDMTKYQEQMKAKMQKATAEASKELTAVVASVKKAETATAEQSKEIEALKAEAKTKDEEIEALKEAVKAKDEELKTLAGDASTTKEDVEQLKKESVEVQETLKKSNQNNRPKAKSKKEEEYA